MEREFDEAGLYLLGQHYGMFSGSVQFDTSGQVDCIDIDPQDGHKSLRLDFDELVRERAAIQKRLDWQPMPLCELLHREASFFKKWMLLQGLRNTLEERFAEDIEDYIDGQSIRETV